MKVDACYFHHGLVELNLGVKMRVLRWVVLLFVVLGVAGCGASSQKSMPNVSGEKLDAAKSDIKNAGYSDDVRVDGGGVLGIWDDSSWVVCSQTPAAGQPLTGTVEVSVDRSCGGDAVSPSESVTDSATASDTVSTSPSPTATASHTESAAPSTITPANNADFDALLADPSGDCDSKASHFVKTYQYDNIEFTGKVASIASHDGDTYMSDVLVTAGRATNFKFSGVETQPGGPVPPGIGLPSKSAALSQGDKVHLVAQVDSFNAGQCLIFLDPVAAQIVR